MQQTTTATRPCTPSAFRVGDLIVDTSRASVSRAGIEIPLPKLSFDLLVACIEAAPAIISIDELMSRVWPGLVVSPETVSQRVKLLRDALGDDPKSPRYIAGVRLRGYRLVASTEPISVASAAVEQAQVAERTQQQRRLFGSRAIAFACLALIAALGLALWYATRDVPTVRSPAASASPLRSIAVLPFENLSTVADGEILAFGIPEAILHQLASVPELLVIARTSSFAFDGANEDVREVGRKLNARFLLEGSVQRDAQRLRITAQLVDSQTGAHVWSMRFDRTPPDVFAMQDEIALEVVRALQLSLDPAVTERLTGSGTANFNAYLAYLQGRAVMAKWRVADLDDAVEHFSQALRLDPAFAPAYVELAAAELRQAEFELTDDRQERFAAALQRGMELIDKALQLDPRNGPAYVERASLMAFTDLAEAESDYRRGLALSPNYARGYQGLAAVLYEDPRRRDEALAMLDRARKLDPLDPAHDITKAVFLLYGRSDVVGAQALLTDVLKRDPLNQAALMRLGEINTVVRGKAADGIKLLEQALSIDPLAEWARGLLVRAYLNVGEPAAARQVVHDAKRRLLVREIPLYVYAHEWQRAGEISYGAVEAETSSPLDEAMIAAAIRQHARLTRDYSRAIEALERLSGVTWDASGRAVLPESLDLKVFPTALGDVLQASGDAARGRAVLEATLVAMHNEAHELARGDLWYLRQRPIVLALLGRRDAAIEALRIAVERGLAQDDAWYYLEIEPSLVALSDDRRFVELRDAVRVDVAEQKQRLAELRSGGFVRRRP
jgi:TolB-like protein/DNA-binding winged helix-turn-helix (wHTH) protein/Tfp pilus assembly protein PilF